MLPNLKLLRRKRGISQQKLADAIGFTQQSINQYENHNIEPDIYTLTLLADYFNTSIDFLVGHTTVRQRIEETEAYQLNAAEADVLMKYRSLTQKEKQCVSTVIETLLEK